MQQIGFRLVALCASVAFLLSGGIARADAFDDARQVYDRGDFGTAREMFRPLAEQGDRYAQTMMGHFTVGGRGFPQDPRESAKWYRLAAAQCEPIAQYQIFFLELTLGMQDHRPVNFPQIVEWLRQSAEQDFPASQWLLSGILRDKKTPIPKSDEESLKWMRRAGAFDLPMVHLDLSNRYARGIGTPIDIDEAYFWASLVALYVERKKGDPSPESKFFISTLTSGKEREQLGNRLAPEQRAEIDRRAAAWRPKPLPPFRTLILTPTELRRGAEQMPGGAGEH